MWEFTGFENFSNVITLLNTVYILAGEPFGTGVEMYRYFRDGFHCDAISDANKALIAALRDFVSDDIKAEIDRIVSLNEAIDNAFWNSVKDAR